MSNIQKHTPLHPKIQEMLNSNKEEIEVGDLFMDSDNRICKIIGFEFMENYKDGHQERVKYMRSERWDGSKFDRSSSSESLIRVLSSWSKLHKSVKEHQEEALKLINGDLSIDDFDDIDSDSLNSENALVSKNAKQTLLILEKEMKLKRDRAELVRKFVGMEMEKRKQALEKIRSDMYAVVEKFKKKMEKVMRHITMIELYLGIEEELIQITEGENAPADTPITFRQLVLFMDEETGITESGGIGIRDVDKFVDWAIKPENLQTCLPEKKGMVVFRPRRTKKDYGDVYLNATMAPEDMLTTFFLIRNGDNLYMINTDKLIITDRLFPKRAELAEFMAEVNKKLEEGHFYDEEKANEEADKMFYKYRKRAMLMQGLIDRTEVFHPLPVEHVNIFKLEETPDAINFVYDDDMLLPSGRLPFKEWKAQINGNIQHGSRILLAMSIDSRNQRASIGERIYYYCNEYNVPKAPETGVYLVEKYNQPETKNMSETNWLEWKAQLDATGVAYTAKITSTERYVKNWEHRSINDKVEYEPGYEIKTNVDHLTIFYNPGDTVYGGWDWRNTEAHERKKRIRLRIYRDDIGVLNYDQISLEDVEFYLRSRADRPNYLAMLPLLHQIKAMRLQEIENEKLFMKLIYGQTFQKVKLSEPELMARIEESVEFWKFKNQIKRPIDKDDTLALRMIVKRLTSKNYEKLKTLNE